MKVLILAGGFATRLWPLTERRAKPLLLLNGKPLISHIVDKIPADLEIIVSTNQVFQADFEKWKKGYAHRKIEIFIEDSGNDDTKKGALGATSLVIQSKQITEDLILIAGDNYFDFNFAEFKSTFQGNPLIAVFDIKEKEEAKKFGVVNMDANKQVLSFEEKPREPSSTLVSTGLYIFPQKNLEDIIEYARSKSDDLGGIFEYFLATKKQRVDCFTFDQGWYDIGSFAAYIDANKVTQKEQLIKKNTAFVDMDSQITGSVFLGENVKIKNSFIQSSLILDNCEITDCVIRDSVIDQNSKLTNLDLTQKMIREGSEIFN